METLKLGQTIETREAQVLLDPTLKPGRYRMQLRVVTRSGESEPAELRIVVLERREVEPRELVSPVISRLSTPLSVLVTTTANAKAKTKPKPKPTPKPKPPAKPKRK